MMPKMSGPETLKILKELPGFAIPVVVLTANAITGMKEKYLKEVNFRKLADKSGVDYKYDIMVCGGTGCKSCKSNKPFIIYPVQYH